MQEQLRWVLGLVAAASLAVATTGCGSEVTIAGGNTAGADAGTGGSGAGGTGAAGGGGIDAGNPCGGSGPGQPWAQRFGDSDGQYGVDIAIDGQCNVVVAGCFNGSIDFGAGPLTTSSTLPTLFLAKLDPNGNALWSKSFEHVNATPMADVAVDPATSAIWLAGTAWDPVDFGGGVLPPGGGDDADVLFAKFDADGNHVVSKRFEDGGGQDSRGAAVDGEGNLVLTGGFTGTVDFGGGALTAQAGTDSFVARFDPAGNHLASWTLTGVQHRLCSLSPAGADSVVIGGESLDVGTLDFGGGHTVTGHNDAFVVRYDGSGTPTFCAMYGDGDDYGESIGATAVDDANHMVLSGNFHGTIDFGAGPVTPSKPFAPLVAKLSPTGDALWSIELPVGYGQGAPVGVVAYPSGNLMVAVRRKTAPSDLDSDTTLHQVSPGGSLLWTKEYLGPGHQRVMSMARAPDGALYLIGQFDQSIELDTATLTSAGGADVFVAKLYP